MGSSFNSVPSNTSKSAPALIPVGNQEWNDLDSTCKCDSCHSPRPMFPLFHTMQRQTSPLPLWIVRICWATTDSTSKSILLNSSKQAQAPQDNSPWEKRVMKIFNFIWLNITLKCCISTSSLHGFNILSRKLLIHLYL